MRMKKEIIEERGEIQRGNLPEKQKINEFNPEIDKLKIVKYLKYSEEFSRDWKGGKKDSNALKRFDNS